MKVFGVLFGERRHDQASLEPARRTRRDESLLLKEAQRIADGRAADPQAARQVHFHDARPRRQKCVHYQVTKLAIRLADVADVPWP